jgi:antitoxin component YwqK of YwqJK toxin-antitoxin module
MKKVFAFLIFSIIILNVNYSIAQNIVQKKSMFYDKKGKPYSGLYTEYYGDNEKDKKAEYKIKEGKLEGEVTYYFENGSKSETGYFANNEKDGQWIKFDESGNKVGEANYKNGIKDGQWFIWFPSGKKYYEMTYKMGEKTGTWYIWNEEGAVVSQKTY